MMHYDQVGGSTSTYVRYLLYAVRSTLEVAVEKLGSDMIGSGRVVSRERWLWRNLRPHLST
jgi:hypothetical protein